VVRPAAISHVADLDLNVLIDLWPALLFFRVLRILLFLLFLLFRGLLRFSRLFVLRLCAFSRVDGNSVNVDVYWLLVVFGLAFLVVGRVAV